MVFFTTKKPILSKSPGVAKSSGIVIMNDKLKGGNYSLITNPVKTHSGKIISSADTQTISYSESMKDAARELAKNGNPIEKAAANYYLFMDDPTKIGSAKYYEDKLKKLGIDINAKSNTGNAVGDFAFDVVKGFVGSPAQTGRVLAAGGLGGTLLSKEKNKTKTLTGGAKNAFDATVQGAIDSPGQFVGGLLAGAAGAKGISVISKAQRKSGKTTTKKNAKTSTTVRGKQTKQSINTKINDTEINNSKNQLRFNSKTKNKKPNPGNTINSSTRNNKSKLVSKTQTAPNFTRNSQKKVKDTNSSKKNSGWTKRKSMSGQIFSARRQTTNPDTIVDMGMEFGFIKMGKQRDRQRKVMSKLGLEDIGDVPYIITRNTGLERVGTAGNRLSGKAYENRAPFTRAKTTTTTLVTAKDARTPKNVSASERARVRRVIKTQKKSGAYKTQIKSKREPDLILSKKLSTDLVTSKDARTPKNKSRKEQIRVSRIVQAQREVGALPADIRIEGNNIRLTSGKQSRSEIKVGKIVSAKVNEKTPILTGKTRSQLKSEEQVRRQKLTRPKPAQNGPKSNSRKTIQTLQNTKQKQTVHKKRRDTINRISLKSVAELRIEANLRNKLSVELERGEVADTLNQVEMVLKNLPKSQKSERVRNQSTHAQRKNSGPGTSNNEPENTGKKTADGKTIYRDKDGTEFVEVDAGNGMMYKVRVKPQETTAQKPSISTSQMKKSNTLPKKRTARKQRAITHNRASRNVKSTAKKTNAALTAKNRKSKNIRRKTTKTTTKNTKSKQTKPTHNTVIIEADVNLGKDQNGLTGKRNNKTVPQKNKRITQIRLESSTSQRTAALKVGSTSSLNTNLTTRKIQKTALTKQQMTKIKRNLSPKQKSKSIPDFKLSLIPTISTYQKGKNMVSVTQAGTGKSTHPISQQPKPKPDADSKKDSDPKIKQTPTVKRSSQQKVKEASAFDEMTQQTLKLKQVTKTTPTSKKKRKSRLKSNEEEVEKGRKKIKKMKEEAYRFETVNTFGWIKDNRPAAKPRRIK